MGFLTEISNNQRVQKSYEKVPDAEYYLQNIAKVERPLYEAEFLELRIPAFRS